MREIRQSADGWLVIGAACTMNQVGLHPLVRRAIRPAGRRPAIRSPRTSSATGRPSAATAATPAPPPTPRPRCYCLEAVAEILRPRTARGACRSTTSSPGPGARRSRPGEFLTGIHLPASRRPIGRRVQQARPDEDRRYLDGQRGGVIARLSTRIRSRHPGGSRSAQSVRPPCARRRPRPSSQRMRRRQGVAPRGRTGRGSRPADRRHPRQRRLPPGDGARAGSPRHRDACWRRSDSQGAPPTAGGRGMKHRISIHGQRRALRP